MAAGQEKEPGAGSSWKSRLTEQQLKRKRTADRESQRESRNAARRTIAKLEEQIQLLTSERPEALTSMLLQQNASIEAERDSYKARLDAVYSALGVTKEGSESICQRGATPAHKPQALDCKDHQLLGKTNDVPEHKAVASREIHPVNLIMDAHMLISQISPFAQICATMQDNVKPMKFSDEDFLEAIIIWKHHSPRTSSVWELASSLYHINLAPTNVTESALQEGVCSPTFFQDVVHELLPRSHEELPCREEIHQAQKFTANKSFSNKPFSGEPNSRLADVVVLEKQEIIYCALQSTRFWHYNSAVERLAMFWAVYRITMLLIFPTAQNLAKCPSWYRPVLSQCSHPHPSFVDFIPWPLIRDRLVHTFEHYQTTDLMSRLIVNLEMDPRWHQHGKPLISVNSTGTDLVLDSAFEASLHDLRTLSMKDDFINSFPELAIYVYHHQDRNKPTVCSSIAGSSDSAEAISMMTDPLPLSWPQPASAVDTSIFHHHLEDPRAPVPLQPESRSLDFFLYDPQGKMDAFFGCDLDQIPVGSFATPFARSSDGFFTV